jgi:hypothetical protein
VRPLAGGEAALAFIAVDPATGRAVGEAHLVRDERDPAAAEVAFAVADAWQNRRLGTRLACLVSRRARELGINRLRANMLAANSRSRALVYGMWRSLLLGLAAAAVSVPTAQARHPDSERGKPTVAGRTNGYATYYRALDLVSEGLNRLVLTTASSPDDRPGVRGPLSRPVVVSARSTPFDWRYAGIGVGSALVVIALFTGGLDRLRLFRRAAPAVRVAASRRGQ